jgi:hypothetical protein
MQLSPLSTVVERAIEGMNRINQSIKRFLASFGRRNEKVLARRLRLHDLHMLKLSRERNASNAKKSKCKTDAEIDAIEIEPRNARMNQHAVPGTLRVVRRNLHPL